MHTPDAFRMPSEVSRRRRPRSAQTKGHRHETTKHIATARTWAGGVGQASPRACCAQRLKRGGPVPTGAKMARLEHPEILHTRACRNGGPLRGRQRHKPLFDRTDIMTALERAWLRIGMHWHHFVDVRLVLVLGASICPPSLAPPYRYPKAPFGMGALLVHQVDVPHASVRRAVPRIETPGNSQ